MFLFYFCLMQGQSGKTQFLCLIFMDKWIYWWILWSQEIFLIQNGCSKNYLVLKKFSPKEFASNKIEIEITYWVKQNCVKKLEPKKILVSMVLSPFNGWDNKISSFHHLYKNIKSLFCKTGKKCIFSKTEKV